MSISYLHNFGKRTAWKKMIIKTCSFFFEERVLWRDLVSNF